MVEESREHSTSAGAPNSSATKQPTPQPAKPHGNADALREQQAIAAAMMLGEQMRREDRHHLYWYAKRIGMFVLALAFVGLVMLFGYVQLRQGDFNATLPMLLIGAAGAVGAVVWYWAHTEERRSTEE